MPRLAIAILVTALTTWCAWPALSQDAPPAGKASIHAQLNPDNLDVVVINNTPRARAGLKLSTEVFALDGRSLLQRTDRVGAVPAKDGVRMPEMQIAPILRQQGSVLIALRLFDNGELVSSNTFWQTAPDGQQAVDDVRRTTIHANSWQVVGTEENHVRVLLENRSKTPALGINLALVDRKGVQLEPAHYSDNGLTLLPGESRRIDIYYATKLADRPRLDITGWNVRSGKVRIASVSETYGQPQQNYVDYTRTYTPPPRASSAEVKLPSK